MGVTFADISSAMPTVSTPLFVSASGASYAKLRVGFNAAARSVSFLRGRADAAVVVEVMSTSADPSVRGSFTWKFVGDVVYQAESPIAASASEGSARALLYADAAGGMANTGLFVWWDATAAGTALSLSEVALGDTYSFTLAYNDGASFSEADGNSAHQITECSSRGACDRASGACACLTGYTGQACERSEEGGGCGVRRSGCMRITRHRLHARPLARSPAPLAHPRPPPALTRAAVCPGLCSGNGICQSQGRFVTDGGISLPGSAALASYAGGFDRLKEFGCKCDAGYRGPECSQSASPPLTGAAPARRRSRHRRCPMSHILSAAAPLTHILFFPLSTPPHLIPPPARPPAPSRASNPSRVPLLRRPAGRRGRRGRPRLQRPRRLRLLDGGLRLRAWLRRRRLRHADQLCLSGGGARTSAGSRTLSDSRRAGKEHWRGGGGGPGRSESKQRSRHPNQRGPSHFKIKCDDAPRRARGRHSSSSSSSSSSSASCSHSTNGFALACTSAPPAPCGLAEAQASTAASSSTSPS